MNTRQQSFLVVFLTVDLMFASPVFEKHYYLFNTTVIRNCRKHLEWWSQKEDAFAQQADEHCTNFCYYSQPPKRRVVCPSPFHGECTGAPSTEGFKLSFSINCETRGFFEFQYPLDQITQIKEEIQFEDFHSVESSNINTNIGLQANQDVLLSCTGNSSLDGGDQIKWTLKLKDIHKDLKSSNSSSSSGLNPSDACIQYLASSVNVKLTRDKLGGFAECYMDAKGNTSRTSSSFTRFSFKFGLPPDADKQGPTLTRKGNELVCDGRYNTTKNTRIWLAFPLTLYTWNDKKASDVKVKSFNSPVEEPMLTLPLPSSSSTSNVWCVASDGTRNSSLAQLEVPPTISVNDEEDYTTVIAIVCVVAGVLILTTAGIVTYIVLKVKGKKNTRIRSSPMNAGQPSQENRDVENTYHEI